jgi:hypothetical protein
MVRAVAQISADHHAENDRDEHRREEDHRESPAVESEEHRVPTLVVGGGRRNHPHWVM